MALIKFENEDKLFIKFFLLDATVNLNTWGVTRQAMLKGLKTFIGKPFVLTADYGHPNASSGDDLLIQQEKYRVGDIIDVGIDTKTDKAYGVAEITSPEAKDIIKNGDVNFVSPSIVFNDEANVADKDGNSIITEFEGAHVAGVAEPAYGIDKAEIKGKCVGSKDSCNLTLQKVEAKVSECGNYLSVKRAKKTQKELDEDYEVQMQSFSKNKEAHEWGEPHKHPHEVTERGGVTEEKYEKITDEYTSNKQKKSKKTNNMTKKSEDERKDEEADETPEDDRVKRGESLDEQYKDKEETDIMKSEEEKDEEDAEEEDDEKDAEDDNKLDLTDKQEKYLKDKDSRLAREVKVLRAELKAMKSKIRKADIDPIIQGILDAKKLVGKVDARAEYRKLSKLDISTLRELQAHYDTIKEAKSQPRYVVRNASINSSDKTGDSLLLSMRGDF